MTDVTIRTYIVNLQVKAKCLVVTSSPERAAALARMQVENGDAAVSEPEVLDVLEAEIA